MSADHAEVYTEVYFRYTIKSTEGDPLLPEGFFIETEEVHVFPEFPSNPATSHWKCSICWPSPVLLDSEAELEQHLELVHKNHYYCEECRVFIFRAMAINRHLSQHEDARVQNANGKGATASKVVAQIMEPYSCRKCSFSTENLWNFNEHLSQHDFSQMSFDQYPASNIAENLQERKFGKQVKKRVRTYTCRVCAESLSDRAQLKKHESIKHNVKHYKYECSICNRKFYYAGRLKQHERVVHAIVNPAKPANTIHKCYRCDDDDNTFSCADTLERHLLAVHYAATDLYRCDICVYSTTKVLEINEHLLRHEKTLRPFKCSICGLGFSKSHNALEHVSGVHGVDHARGALLDSICSGYCICCK